MNLLEALDKLDPGLEDHWTQAGLPKLEVLQNFIGEVVTREDIEEASPGFKRDSVDLNDIGLEKEEIAINKLKEEIKSKDHSINKKREEIILLNKQIEMEGRELEKIKNKLELLYPGGTNQENIKNYIKSQNEIRIAKHERTAKILKDIDPKILNPRSPLDTAMMRKNSRGNKRPVRI